MFLKYAFRDSSEGPALYTSSVFSENDCVIEDIQMILDQGTCTEMILNVLVHAEWSRWGQKKLKDFIDWIDGIVDPEKEPEIVMKCWNPIQAICLCCDFLTKIGTAVSVF